VKEAADAVGRSSTCLRSSPAAGSGSGARGFSLQGPGERGSEYQEFKVL
jgi:hypothetical protein